MSAQTRKTECRRGWRYREYLQGIDLSLGECARLCANTYAPHPKTVKVLPLSLFSLGAKELSICAVLGDMLSDCLLESFLKQ